MEGAAVVPDSAVDGIFPGNLLVLLSDSLSGERNSSVLWFLPATGNPLCDRLGGNHTKPLSLSQAQQRFLRSGADPGDGSGIRSLDSSASAAHPVRIFLLLNGD